MTNQESGDLNDVPALNRYCYHLAGVGGISRLFPHSVGSSRPPVKSV